MTRNDPFSPASPGAPGTIHPVVVAPESVPERRGAVSFLSRVRRDGDWMLPRNFRAVAFMGNVDIDLSSARVGAGTSHIEVRSILGAVTIIVPPEIRVECEGDPILGSFEVKHEAPTTAAPDAPVVRITGAAIMGSVDVKVVDPNAPKWYERILARWEERRRRG